MKPLSHAVVVVVIALLLLGLYVALDAARAEPKAPAPAPVPSEDGRAEAAEGMLGVGLDRFGLRPGLDFLQYGVRVAGSSVALAPARAAR